MILAMFLLQQFKEMRKKQFLNFLQGADSIFNSENRYPLYGGWKYKWFHGYDVPINNYLKKIGPNRYQLKMKFTGSLKNILVEDMAVSYVLPEGATYDLFYNIL